MSDTNHHVLTGKLDITSNLLVGSSHLFVDPNNNSVGLVTTDPHAGLHVNSNAYVNTDLRVGPAGPNQVVINATAGRIKAASFEGDGSLLQNTPPGAAATIAVGTTTTGAAGTSASVTNSGTTSAAVFNFTIPKGDQGIQGIPGNDGDDGAPGADGTNYFTLSGTDIYRDAGNVGIGGSDTPTARLTVFNSITSSDNSIPAANMGENTAFPNSTHMWIANKHSSYAPYWGLAVGTIWSGSSYLQNLNKRTNTYYNLLLQPNGGNVGIGMVSPQDKLHTDIIRIGDWDGGGNGFRFSMDTNASLRIQYMSGQTVHSNIMSLGYNTGDVGIGVASPDSKLEVRGNIQASESDTNHGLFLQTNGTIRRDYGGNGSGIHFTANGIRPTNYLGSYSNGGIDLGQSNYRWNNVYTETLNAVRNGVVAEFTPASSGSYTLINFHSKVNNGSDRGFILVQDESANLPGSSSEDLRMTIGVYNDFNQSTAHSDELWLQGGGRLCFNVGSWDSELNSIIGTPGSGTSNNGQRYEWRISNSKKMQLNSDGQLTLGPGGGSTYVNIRNDGTWWRNYIGLGAGIHLTGGAVMPTNASGNWPYSATLGTSTYKWGQIYSTSGSIDTSDRTTKQDINEMTESEKKVAVKMVNLFRTYRVKDAVEEKGEKARVHSGVVAQDLIEAFQSEGLDAHRYGLFCYDDVWMVDGKDELFETVYTKNGNRNFVDENGVWREYTADDEGVEEVKEGTGIFADKDTPGAVATPGLYSIRYNELLCFVVGGVLKDLQTTDADLKKELQSEKEKVATMELLVASLVKRVGDLENLVI